MHNGVRTTCTTVALCICLYPTRLTPALWIPLLCLGTTAHCLPCCYFDLPQFCVCSHCMQLPVTTRYLYRFQHSLSCCYFVLGTTLLTSVPHLHATYLCYRRFEPHPFVHCTHLPLPCSPFTHWYPSFVLVLYAFFVCTFTAPTFYFPALPSPAPARLPTTVLRYLTHAGLCSDFHSGFLSHLYTNHLV